MSTLPLFEAPRKPGTQKLTELALDASPTMTEVSREQFFAYIGPRNIMPSIYGSSKDELGMYSIFKTVHGDAVGKIFGGNHISDSIFLLRTELAKDKP
jgi:hypothetical protein